MIKRTQPAVFGALALVLSVASPTFGQASEESPSDRIQELISAYAAHRAFEGAVLVAQDGLKVYEGAFGFAVREWEIPNTPHTRFLIASVTKPVTAALVMRLVESGLLDLEEPITTYLPSYRPETGNRITVHHLLSHTSGIPNYAIWPEFWDENPSRMKYEKEDFVARFCSGDLLYTPGSSSHYSDANYVLLALIVERATGLSWEEGLGQWILDPLHMTNSGIVREDTVIDRRAHGYLLRRDTFAVPPYINYEGTQMGAGDMFSTVGDLLLFEQALSQGGFLQEESRSRIFRAHAASGFSDMHTGYGWNLGTEALRDSGREIRIAHAPGNNAGFTTVIYRMPESRSTIVIAANVGPGPLDMQVYAMCREIAHVLQGESCQVPRPSIVGPLVTLLSERGIAAADSAYRAMKGSGEYDLDTRGMNRLGYRLLGEERHAEAVAVFEWNVESDPSWGNAYDSLGEALLIRGDRERAIESYRKALKLDPGNENAARILDELGVTGQDSREP